MLAVTARAGDPNQRSFDVSLQGRAAGVSGDVTGRGLDADLDVGFDDVLENLEFGAMGTVRVGYDRRAFRTEVIDMASARPRAR